MRVIQANKAYLPHVGGIETVVQQLAEGIAADPAHESLVVACSDSRHTHRERHNGVSVLYAGTLARVASLPVSPSYARQLLGERADILHIHEPSLLAAAACRAFPRAARRRFGRLVIWWHSDIVRQRALKSVYRPLLRRTLQEADAVVVATPKHISSSRFLPEFASKCRVIPYGIEPERFRPAPSRRQAAAALRARFGKPLVLFTGRLVYYKGVEFLIDAMREVPQAHLVVVGRGPLRTALEQRALRCPGNVTLIPYLEEADLLAMYEACTLFVLPSVAESEAFGLVQLEAMAMGKPVITTDLQTGVTHVNQDGVTGLVVPRRDSRALAGAITTLLADSDLRGRLGETARRRALREFTVAGMVRQTLDLYHELLARDLRAPGPPLAHATRRSA